MWHIVGAVEWVLRGVGDWGFLSVNEGVLFGAVGDVFLDVLGGINKPD